MAEVNSSLGHDCYGNENATNDNPLEHPKELNLTEAEDVAMDTDDELLEHTNCHSLPVTPMKPRQSASESSDYHNKDHTSLLPRRSQSYEHIEELGVTPVLPGSQSINFGSGGFSYRRNPLPSVGSAHDVLGEYYLEEYY